MKLLDICKETSKAFNSSHSYDEFLIKLDLVGIDVNEAEEKWSASNALLLKYYPQWCNRNATISFAKMFTTTTYMSIVLPYACKLSKSKLVFKAIDGLGNTIVRSAYSDMQDDPLLKLHGIDVVHELIATLLYEMSVECKMQRSQGVGHGQV